MLCATDFSQHSLKVVARATVMANELDATLTLLHVIGTGQENHAFVSGRIQRQLKSLHGRIRRESTVSLQSSGYVSTIASAAEEAGADLVILDAKPWKPALSPIAMTAGELAAQVRRPVLIVKRESQTPYASVLIAAEQSPAFEHLLRMLSSWRLLECESVVIIHGFEAPYRGPLFAAGFERRSSIRNNEQWELAARRRLLQGLDTPGVAGDRFRCIFVQSRPVREIQREVRRMVPDLLVLATGHHAAVDRVMRAGIGNDLLRNIECDVLAAPVKLS